MWLGSFLKPATNRRPDVVDVLDVRRNMDLLEAFIFYCDVVELALAKASEEASEGNERAESRWQRDCKLNSRCGGAGPVPRYGDTPLVTEIPYRVIMKGAASGAGVM